MNPSPNTVWPLAGVIKIILRVIWVLAALFFLLLFLVTLPENLEVAQRGMVGIMLNQLDDGSIVVKAVLPGGPADQAGIQTGDQLLEIDSLTVSPNLNVASVVEFVLGDVGEPVTLRVASPDQAARLVEIVRARQWSDLIQFGLQLIQVAACFLAGWYLFFKHPNSGYSLFSALTLVTLGASIGGITVYSAGLELFLVYALVMILLLNLLLTFPDGRYVPVWSLGIGLLGLALHCLSLFPYPLDPFEWPPGLYLLTLALLFGAGFICQFYRYRRIATPDEKRQLRQLGWGAVALALVIFVLNPIQNLPAVAEWLYLHPLIQITVSALACIVYAIFAYLLVISLLKEKTQPLTTATGESSS